MAALVVQVSTAAGFTPTYAAATVGGDTVNAGDHIGLRAKNSSGGALRITIGSTNTGCSQGFVHPISPSVGAGVTDFIIEPLTAARYADANGVIALTYPDGVTGLTVAAIQY
jgi:hypothetical protein